MTFDLESGNKIPAIRKSRFTLQPLRTGDAEVLYKIYQTEGVLRYFPSPKPPTMERMQRFLDLQTQHWNEHGYGNWGILPEGSQRIIGWGGLQFLPELNETEVGFLLDKPFWGRGYATEIARASLKFGFETIGLDLIIALVHPENLASSHVVEKCGMEYVETMALWGIDLKRSRIDRKRFISAPIPRDMGGAAVP